jgi:hypothetical protein
MQSWSPRPDRDPLTLHLDLLRARPGKTFSGIVLSNDIEGAYTHYWRGRTVKCDGQPCEACLASRQPRWYGYVAIWLPTSNAKALLELTPTCVPQIDEYFKLHGTLRGSLISLTRQNNKINSRVIAKIQEANYTTTAIPQDPPVRQLLERMWEVTPKNSIEAPERADASVETRRVGPKPNGRFPAKQN